MADDEKSFLKASSASNSSSLLRSNNSSVNKDSVGNSTMLTPRKQSIMKRKCFDSRTKERIEIGVLVSAIVVVIVLFLCPVFLHYFAPPNLYHDKYNCLHTINESTCDEIRWAEVQNSSLCSTREKYTGDSCGEFLNDWESCAVGQGDIYVNVSENQTIQELEMNLKAVIEFIEQQEESCRKPGTQFICQYVFTLCDLDTKNTTFLPTREECEYISTEVCAKPWNEASKYFPLPSCDELPSQTHPIIMNGSHPTHAPVNSSDLTCNDQFFEENGTCLPSCYKFKQDSEHVWIYINFIEKWTGVFGFTMSVVVILVSVVRRKAVLTFPSILIFYMTLSYSFMGLFLIITFIAPNALYCNTENLFKVINHPTPFCTLSGIVFHYCLVNSTLWWFFHVSVLFYKLIFPMKAKRTEKYEKFLHLTLIALGLLLPLPGVIYTLLASKYAIGQLPPLLCIPESPDVWYYSTILPFNILVGIGVLMFLPMFWIIHKHVQGTMHRGKMLSVAERKIIFVLCYYALFGVSVLTYFGVTTSEETKFIKAIVAYSECQLFGDSKYCNPECFRQYTIPGIKGACFILMSFIPFANLVFVVNWKAVGSFIDSSIARVRSVTRAKSGHHELKNNHGHSEFSVQPETVD